MYIVLPRIFQLKDRKLGHSFTGSFPHWSKAALKLFNSLLFWIVLLGSQVDSCSFGKCLKASNGMLSTCLWVHMALSTAAAAEIRGELRGCEAVQQKPMMQLAMISESNTLRDIFILQTLKLSLEQSTAPWGNCPKRTRLIWTCKFDIYLLFGRGLILHLLGGSTNQNCKVEKYIFLINSLFFRTFLNLHKNWADNTEHDHVLPTPPHTDSPIINILI